MTSLGDDARETLTIAGLEKAKKRSLEQHLRLRAPQTWTVLCASVDQYLRTTVDSSSQPSPMEVGSVMSSPFSCLLFPASLFLLSLFLPPLFLLSVFPALPFSCFPLSPLLSLFLHLLLPFPAPSPFSASLSSLFLPPPLIFSTPPVSFLSAPPLPFSASSSPFSAPLTFSAPSFFCRVDSLSHVCRSSCWNASARAGTR